MGSLKQKTSEKSKALKPFSLALVSYSCFRHETPVLSKPIEVVHLSEELVVLDKPCSLPVSSLLLIPRRLEKAADVRDTDIVLETLFSFFSQNQPHIGWNLVAFSKSVATPLPLLPSGVERGTFVWRHH